MDSRFREIEPVTLPVTTGDNLRRGGIVLSGACDFNKKEASTAGVYLRQKANGSLEKGGEESSGRSVGPRPITVYA